MFSEILKEVLPAIEKAAPYIATAIGAPGWAIPAISILCKAFDVEQEKLPDLIRNINEDPDAEGKLKSAQDTWVQYISGFFGKRYPLKAEINLKLEWEPTA